MKIKLKYRLKDNHLFFKIFSYFLLLLIPTLVIGIMTYCFSIYIIRKNFNEQISANLDSAINMVDTYIRTAQEIGISFFDDENVQDLLLPSDAQTEGSNVDLWKIPRLIQKDENVSGGFADRTFAYTDTQAVFVDGGIDEYDSFFDKFYRYKKYDTLFWKRELNSDKSLEILPPSEVRQSGSRKISTVVPVIMTRQMNNGNIVMVQNISADSIVNVLSGNSVFKSTEYVVTDGQGNIIFDKNGFMSAPEAKSVFHKTSFGKGRNHTVQLKGEKYIGTYSESKLCGWRYYALTPSSNYSGQASNILLMIVLLCIMLIIMGIVISYIFSLNIYNPIRNIRDIILRENSKLSVAGGKSKGDEIQTIREGISALSVSQARNETILNTFSLNFIENTVFLMIEGEPVDTHTFLKMLGDYAGFHQKEYICGVIQIRFNGNFNSDFNQVEQNEILNEIQKIIRSYTGEGLKVFLICNQQQFLCLANIGGEKEEQIFTGNLTRLNQLFEYDDYYCDVKIGISRRFDHIDKIGSAFDEAMTAIIMSGSKKSFEITEATEESYSDTLCYSTMDEQRILNCLSASDLNELRAVIQKVWEKNVARRVFYRQLRQLFREMHFTGIRFLEERGVPREQIRLKNDSGVQPSEFSICADLEQFENSLMDFYRTVINIAGCRAKSKSDELPSMIEEYIKKNYANNLSLEQIAGEMNVSVKYVSRIFKEKTGTNLTAFINQVRMNKAKELLLQTDMTVNEVADQIGIDSRTTFLRIFKKVAGITPNEYRIANRAQAELSSHR